LSGELTVALKKGLRKKAKKALREKSAIERLRKKAKNNELLNDLEISIQHLEEIAESGIKKSNAENIAKSFFENAKIVIKEYKPIGNILGQSNDYTCVANSLRMVLDDLNIIRSEIYIAEALETTIDGAYIANIPKALPNLYADNIKTIVRGVNNKYKTVLGNLIDIFKNTKCIKNILQ